VINHISFGVAQWDTDGVAAELTKRGLSARPDTGGSLEIHDEKRHILRRRDHDRPGIRG
jgi:hypothetical protein